MSSPFMLIPFVSIIILNLPLKGIMRNAALGIGIFSALSQVALAITHPASDMLTFVALVSIGTVLFIALLTGRSMLTDEPKRFNFINLALVAQLGMNVTATATDIFSVYVFIEVTAIASFILIAIMNDKFAVEGAFKYLMLSAIASVMMLSSIGLMLLYSAGTSFESIAFALKISGGAILLKLAVVLFLCGLCIKAGVVPFHGWLPDAYSAASAPVSVLLAGIVTKVSGVYVILRLVTSVFAGQVQIQKFIMLLGCVSIVTGALLSLTQTNFKRLLSYSSVSQVGYIILAAGCGTPLAMIGAAAHFFNHAIFKSLLFVNAAAVEKQTGTQDINRMGGLAGRMPVTGVTSVIGFLSTAGIPPLAGFWSKLIIVIALWKAGYVGYAFIALFASVITLGYLLYLQRQVFFGKLTAGFEKVKEAEFGLVLPQVILAAITVIVGLGFPLILLWR